MFVERESGTYLKYIFPYKLIVNQHQINVRLQINRDLQRMLPLFHDKNITLLMISKDKSYAFVTIRVSTFKSSCGVVAGFPSGYWITFLARNIVT